MLLVKNLHKELTRLTVDKPEDWMKSYGTARQEHRREVTILIDMAAREFAAGQPTLLAKFDRQRRAFFEMLDRHQAKWPVLTLGKERAEDYRASVTKVQVQHSELLRFIRSRV